MRSKLFSCGLLAVLLAVVPAGAAAQDAGSESVPASEDPEVRALLGAGWAFLEMGSLRKADEAFKAALEHPLGRSCAETYFGLAGVWWERRNAMAAYQRLQEAQAASAGNFRWDPGAGGAWDARIEARMRFIERNFTVIQLKFEGRKVLPPLADPQPTDPLLLEFGQRLPAVLDEHIEAGASTLWLLLPNGGWWVGDSLEELGGGEMNPARASAWRLPRARGAAARTHGERVAALARGESPAAELRGRTPADPAGSTEVRAEDSSSTPEAGASVAGGDGEVLEGRRFYVAVGGGGVPVGSQQVCLFIIQHVLVITLPAH